MAENNYPAIAGEVLGLCAANDPYFPNGGDATILAWAESLAHFKIDREDALAAIRKLYRENPAPDFRPSIGALCSTARALRQDRIDREGSEIDGPEKISLAEWKRRHPDIVMPTAIGKGVDD